MVKRLEGSRCRTRAVGDGFERALRLIFSGCRWGVFSAANHGLGASSSCVCWRRDLSISISWEAFERRGRRDIGSRYARTAAAGQAVDVLHRVDGKNARGLLNSPLQQVPSRIDAFTKLAAEAFFEVRLGSEKSSANTSNHATRDKVDSRHQSRLEQPL